MSELENRVLPPLAPVAASSVAPGTQPHSLDKANPFLVKVKMAWIATLLHGTKLYRTQGDCRHPQEQDRLKMRNDKHSVLVQHLFGTEPWTGTCVLHVI